MKGHIELLMTENLKQVHAKLTKTLKVQIIKNNVFHGSTNSNNDSNDGKENHYVNVGCTQQTMQKVALMRGSSVPSSTIRCKMDEAIYHRTGDARVGSTNYTHKGL